jgi:hypothetical protein
MSKKISNVALLTFEGAAFRSCFTFIIAYKYGFVKKIYLVRSATNIYASFPKLHCRNVVF